MTETGSAHSNQFDEMTVHRLMVTFAAAADDSPTVEAVSALFTEDGTFEVGGQMHRGREAIGHYLQLNRDAGFAGPLAGTRHLLTNLHAESRSDGSAVGGSEWLLVRRADASAAPTLVATGRYRDRYVQVEGQWLIAERSVQP